MNRRDILGLSAITAFGLGLLPGNAVAQRSDTDKVKAVHEPKIWGLHSDA